MKNYYFLNLIVESWKVYKWVKLFEEINVSFFGLVNLEISILF